MQKKFKELRNGETFRLVGAEIPESRRSHVYVKIPFMRNFYTTTGNKRNARLVVSTSKMNNKFVYVADEQTVETVQ